MGKTNRLIDIQEGGTDVLTEVSLIDFDSDDFNVTATPAENKVTIETNAIDPIPLIIALG